MNWIPVTTREATEEEQKQGYTFMFTCEMPDIGERVLICGRNWVEIDEVIDGGIGLELDSGTDWDDVVAWAALPEPIKPNQSDIEYHKELAAKRQKLHEMTYNDGYEDGLSDMFNCIMTILHFSIAEHREIFGDKWVHDSLINTIEEMSAKEFVDCVNDWVDRQEKKSLSYGISEAEAKEFEDKWDKWINKEKGEE